MAYLNKVMLIGNIGKDPEIRMSQSGRKSVQFSLATSRRYRDNNGEQKEDTQWHSVIGWGKTAEIIEQLGVRKGMSLYVEGELTNRSWTDNQGQKRYMTQVNMDTFQLLTPRTTPQHQPSTQGYNPYGSEARANGTVDYAQDDNGYNDPGDDLPF